MSSVYFCLSISSLLGRCEGWLGFPDLWSGQKPWWKLYLISVKSGEPSEPNPLSSPHVGAPGIFSDLSRSVGMIKGVWVRKATGNSRTYSCLVKLQPWFLSLQWKTYHWTDLQPWFLRLQWRTCAWAENSDDDAYEDESTGTIFFHYIGTKFHCS